MLGYVIARPYAEIGIDDDWSYVKTAQVLAQTGKISYNGWGSPMLGWQLYFADLFVKSFGFSFTAVRLSILFVAIATAILLQRTFVRTGINEWNATVATMAFVLSPLFFPVAVLYMTDVPGIFCILLCLYMCLRTIQAESERAAMFWIFLAALTNAIGGTARQTAWLGVLVMVPSTLWLLRRNRRVLVTGCLSWFAAVGFVIATSLWFVRQPFSNSLPLLPSIISWRSLRSLCFSGLLGIAFLSMLLVPVLLMFGRPLLRAWNRRTAAVFVAGFAGIVLLIIVLFMTSKSGLFVAPFVLGYMVELVLENLNGSVDYFVAPQQIATGWLRLWLTGATAIGALTFLSYALGTAERRDVPSLKDAHISWQKLAVVLGPFTFVYIAWLGDMIIEGNFFDRYFLPLFLISLLVLTLHYQQNAGNLPLTCVLLIAIFGGFSVAGTHDEFAMYRGSVDAIDVLHSRGVPDSSIWGPVEFNGWNQIDKTGYVNAPWILIPKGAYAPAPARDFSPDCDLGFHNFLSFVPDIKPVYAVSLNPKACDGLAGIQPVQYTSWLPPRTRSIYVIKLPAWLSR